MALFLLTLAACSDSASNDAPDVPATPSAPAGDERREPSGPSEQPPPPAPVVDAGQDRQDASTGPACGSGVAPDSATTFVGRVTAIYLVPSDQAVDPIKEAFFRCAMQYVQGWYRTSTGESFRWSFRTLKAKSTAATFDCARDVNDPACYDRVVADLKGAGLPVYAEGTALAVALQSNLSTWRGTRIEGAAASNAGGFMLLGADLFKQLIDAKCAPAACKTTWKGNGHTGDFVTGGIAHELGHAFGLPHPDPNEAGGTQSVMGSHYSFPVNTFLPRELVALKANPLFSTF